MAPPLRRLWGVYPASSTWAKRVAVLNIDLIMGMVTGLPAGCCVVSSNGEEGLTVMLTAVR